MQAVASYSLIVLAWASTVAVVSISRGPAWVSRVLGVSQKLWLVGALVGTGVGLLGGSPVIGFGIAYVSALAWWFSRLTRRRLVFALASGPYMPPARSDRAAAVWNSATFLAGASAFAAGAGFWLRESDRFVSSIGFALAIELGFVVLALAWQARRMSE